MSLHTLLWNALVGKQTTLGYVANTLVIYQMEPAIMPHKKWNGTMSFTSRFLNPVHLFILSRQGKQVAEMLKPKVQPIDLFHFLIPKQWNPSSLSELFCFFLQNSYYEFHRTVSIRQQTSSLRFHLENPQTPRFSHNNILRIVQPI